MRLGILVNTNKTSKKVLHLTNAALGERTRGHSFTWTRGARLLEQPFFTGLCSPGCHEFFADHSAERLGVKTEGIPKERPAEASIIMPLCSITPTRSSSCNP